MSIRVGQVSSVNPINCSARVAFDDLDGLVSAELPILQKSTGALKTYSLPQIGEHVVCVFLPNGIEEGFVIGSSYTANNMPANPSSDVYRANFADGSSFEYNLSNHTLKISGVDSVEIDSSNKISIKPQNALEIDSTAINFSSNINVIGDVNITGNLTASGEIHGSNI
jgi:phage baseplate assembly protein V